MLSSSPFSRFSKMETNAATSSNVWLHIAKRGDLNPASSAITLILATKTLRVAWNDMQNAAEGKISLKRPAKQKTSPKQERRWQMQKRMAQSQQCSRGSRERVH